MKSSQNGTGHPQKPLWSKGASIIKYCVLILLLLGVWVMPSHSRAQDCTPTRQEEIGPFYRPGAEARDKVGEGFVLEGKVLSTVGCRPVMGAMIEYWSTNPQGIYDDEHRGVIFSDIHGLYRFESNPPTHYVGRPPHFHLRITAKGHEELITQYYPKPQQQHARFDLILEVQNSQDIKH